MTKFAYSVLLQLLVGVATGQQYFPDHAFNQKEDTNERSVRWYRGQLKALEDTSLFEISKQSSSAGL